MYTTRREYHSFHWNNRQYTHGCRRKSLVEVILLLGSACFARATRISGSAFKSIGDSEQSPQYFDTTTIGFYIHRTIDYVLHGVRSNTHRSKIEVIKQVDEMFITSSQRLTSRPSSMRLDTLVEVMRSKTIHLVLTAHSVLTSLSKPRKIRKHSNKRYYLWHPWRSCRPSLFSTTWCLSLLSWARTSSTVTIHIALRSSKRYTRLFYSIRV